ncbi:MAG: RNA-binding protein [Chloroflexi bacterium]|nr:RNA-binding protein [Chloroflexota bacterium]
MEIKLYVGNLSYDATEEELRELFSQAGAVRSVSLITDRDTGRPRGFAFVEMESSAEAEKAVSMLNGYLLRDRQLRVSEARPREERGGGERGGGERRGGGFRGGRGGGRRGRY